MKANIKDLQAKPTIINTPSGEVEVYPLNLEAQAEFNILMKENPENPAKPALLLAKYTLKRAFPEATDEEINNIQDDILGPVMTEAMRINGFSVNKNPEEQPHKQVGLKN